MQHLYNYTARRHLDEIYVKYGLEVDTTVSKLLSTLWSQFHSELIWIYLILHALSKFLFLLLSCVYL